MKTRKTEIEEIDIIVIITFFFIKYLKNNKYFLSSFLLLSVFYVNNIFVFEEFFNVL